MGIMADAYKYFCGGVDFSSDAICPADDPARCSCTNTAINREATTYKISTLVAGALLVVLAFIFFWQRKRLFRMVQSHRRKAVDKEEYEQTDNFIADSEQELEALRVQKEAEQDESKRVRLELRQRKLASIIQTTKLKCEERAIARNLLNGSAICKRIGVADSLTEADWLQLDREVDDHFPAFRNRISEICKISDHEYQVNVLIKAGVPVGKMAALTFCTVSSISKCRQRQYQRAFGVKGKPEDWDTFIHCL